MEPPSFKYLRPENFNKLDDKQVESIEKLTRFHIDSFDWMIDQGLQHAIKVRFFFLIYRRDCHCTRSVMARSQPFSNLSASRIVSTNKDSYLSTIECKAWDVVCLRFDMVCVQLQS